VRFALIVCGSFGFLVACNAAEPRGASAGAELVRAEAPAHEAPQHQVSARELVLDERADGARLLATVVPALEGTDADRLLAARLEIRGRIVSSPWLDRVIDARFVGAERIVLIDAQHTLLLVEGGEAIPIDEGAEAPLAVRGEAIVYARGDMPFFELARLDAATHVVTPLTEGYAPAYSPAIDADGSVVFVSTREGRPRLHRVASGEVTALAPTQRTPSSPRAPRLEQGLLSFEDERGTITIDVVTGREVAR
jgi:hypothetical protein